MHQMKRLMGIDKRYWYAAAALIVIAVVGYAFLRPKATEEATVSVRNVDVKSVAELASQTAPLAIGGTVSSKSEATVRAESGGRVTAVYRNLGDAVAAGTIVAELDHASQSAALLQAQGAQAAAEAALAKVQKGTRTEQLGNLESALDGAK